MFINLMNDLEPKLKLYFGLTLACSFFDFIDFIIQLVRFGGKGDVSYKILNQNLLLGILRHCYVNFVGHFLDSRLLLCLLDFPT